MSQRFRPVVVVLVAALGLAACTGKNDAAVATGPVGRSTVSEVVEASANVVARASAAVNVPASGTLATLTVADGSRVHKGQVIARVASASAQSALRQAESADKQAARSSKTTVTSSGLGSSQDAADAAAKKAFTAAHTAALALPAGSVRTTALAQVANAKAAYAAAAAQSRQTMANLNAGLTSLERALSSLSAAQRVQTKAALSAAKSTVKALTVHAPIDGVVSLGPGTGGSTSNASSLIGSLPQSVQGAASSLLGSDATSMGSGSGAGVGVARVGSPVTSGGLLATITDDSVLSLEAQVDETDVLLVKAGVQADVELDAVPDATYAAHVTAVDLTPAQSTGGGVAYVVRLALGAGKTAAGGKAPTPRPGMSAVARLHVRTSRNVLAVPAAAVFHVGSQEAVWKVVNGKAVRTTVQLGAQGERTVAIIAGVKLGDVIVVKGADRVRAGGTVPAPSASAS